MTEKKLFQTLKMYTPRHIIIIIIFGIIINYNTSAVEVPLPLFLKINFKQPH